MEICNSLLKIKTYNRKPFTLIHKVAYQLIKDLDGKEVSHKELGEIIGITSRTTVIKVIKQLKDFGLITQKGEVGKMNYYLSEVLDFSLVDMKSEDLNSVLYLFQIDSAHYKIGVTSNLDARRKSLENEFCRDLKLIWNSYSMERLKAESIEREILMSITSCGFHGKYPKEVFKRVNIERLVSTLSIKTKEK